MPIYQVEAVELFGNTLGHATCTNNRHSNWREGWNYICPKDEIKTAWTTQNLLQFSGIFEYQYFFFSFWINPLIIIDELYYIFNLYYIRWRIMIWYIEYLDLVYGRNYLHSGSTEVMFIDECLNVCTSLLK